MPNKKEEKNTAIKIVAVVIVILVVLTIIGIAWYLGLINIPFLQSGTDGLNPMGFEGCLVDLQASDVEIFTALETLMGKTLNFANVSLYIDTLHMKMYGDICHSALQAMEVYEADYALNGWAPAEGGRDSTHGIGWFAYYEIWIRGDQARFVASGEGAIVTSTYGYSAVVLVAYGSTTTAEQFMDECG